MSNRRPDNGLSLSKATYKPSRPALAPSPERRQEELNQLARDCADRLLLGKNPAAWYDAHSEAIRELVEKATKPKKKP
jgi:hypothetical protein